MRGKCDVFCMQQNAIGFHGLLGKHICRSAGEGGVAAFVETAGAVLALAAALPLMGAVLALLEELL